jgi:N-acetylglucosaminyldiphosphoundecaprenol N-acetyl-beta-D-mannosaminyltransferase
MANAAGLGPTWPVVTFLGVPFHPFDLSSARGIIAGWPSDRPFCYVVTPNAAHVAKIDENRDMYLPLYTSAWLSINDSRIISGLGKLRGLALPTAAGSDLVSILFNNVIRPDDRIVIIGCAVDEVAKLRRLYHLGNIHHYNPAMGLADNPEEIQRCVDFVVSHPARFVFIAVGMPQQEILAHRVLQNGYAVGLGLCIGGSLHFLAGSKLRAPPWMRRVGLEWLHRLLLEPFRLWRRYLVESPVVFGLFLREMRTTASKRRSVNDALPLPRPIPSAPTETH